MAKKNDINVVGTAKEELREGFRTEAKSRIKELSLAILKSKKAIKRDMAQIERIQADLAEDLKEI
jgi:hypothetical protein